jgi:hypothetical protein
MNSQPSPVKPPIGLLELDQRGTVIRYDPAVEQGARRKDVIGRDFFAEVLPVQQLYGVRARFLAFMAGGCAVEKFSLTVLCGGRAVNMQVVLAAMTERRAGRRERVALVRITPEQGRVVA